MIIGGLKRILYHLSNEAKYLLCPSYRKKLEMLDLRGEVGCLRMEVGALHLKVQCAKSCNFSDDRF